MPQEKEPKATIKDPTPWESRYGWKLALDRRVGEARKDNFPDLTMEMFKEKMTSMREAIYRWAGQKVKEVFVDKMHEKFDEQDQLRWQGRKINSVAGFLEIIKAGPWNDEMRRMVAYAQDTLWDTSNDWTKPLVTEISDLMAIKWSGSHANKNRPEGRTTDGNCIKHLLVKRKNSLVTNFRDNTRRIHYEGIWCREVPEKKPKEKVGTTKASRIPRVVEYIRVTHAVSGFIGYIGYCEGHPKLKVPAVATLDSPSGSNASTLTPNHDECTPDHRLWGDTNKPRNGLESDDSGDSLTTAKTDSTTAGCHNTLVKDRIAYMEDFITCQNAKIERWRAGSEYCCVFDVLLVSFTSHPLILLNQHKQRMTSFQWTSTST